MDQWSRVLKRKMDENLVKRYANSKYVDDCNMALESIGLGTRWVEKTGETPHLGESTLAWREDWEKSDLEKGVSHSKVTLDGLLGMANSINPSLHFKGDIPEYHEDSTLPMLDFCTWIDSSSSKPLIKHKFYEKPCASNMVIEASSSQPHKVKINTLSQEVIRRMKNTGRDVDWNIRAEIIFDLKLKMLRSGYSNSSITNILNSGLKGYYRMVSTKLAGGEESIENRR